jgi:hypothetical protein
MKRQRALSPWAPLFALALAAGCGSSDDGSGGAEQSAAQTESGLSNLNAETSEGLAQALVDLQAAVQSDPSNDLAHALLGGVRLAAWADDNRMPTDGSQPSALAELLAGFGVDMGGASIFELGDDVEGGELPDPTSWLPLPDDAPQLGDIQALLSGELLSAVRQTAADWEAVTPGFSQVVQLLGQSVEIDYGDLRLAAAAARGVEAALRLQSAWVLELDIDELANWESNGLAQPYRIFAGDSGANVIPGQTTAGGRKAMLNEMVLLDTTDTFLLAPGAQQAFDGVRGALIAALANLQAGLAYVEDPDPTDDLLQLPPELGCPIGLAAPWIADLADALSGGDPVVAALTAENAECALELPGFTLDVNVLFSTLLWDGRPLFPDYPDGTTSADESSWAHLLDDPLFQQLLADFGGDPPTGADMLEIWNAVNALWDIVFAGEPLEETY